MLKTLKQFDWALLGSILLLLTVGLLSIASASLARTGLALNFQKQLIFAFLGLALFFLFSFIDYRFLRNYSAIVVVTYLVSLASLFLLLLISHKTRGAVSWFKIGGLGFEPMEIMKVILIATLAKYFSTRHIEIGLFSHIIASGVYVFLPVGLIMLQPDLGGAVLMVAVWLGIMIFAGIRLRHLIALMLIFMILASIGWLFVLKDYQRARIVTFLGYEKDPLGRDYNVAQSMIAVGSGGIFGKGLGHGPQSQLNFLPEQHTDFIFATIAEEWGLVGVAFILILWGVIFWRLMLIGMRAGTNFAKFFVFGFLVSLLVQVFINIAINMGIMPVTGIPLPILSYGGSSLISTLLTFGIIQNISLNSYGA